MSDEDLWWLFLHHKEGCTREFWAELENRKAAGTLAKDSPFWAITKVGRNSATRTSNSSNVIELTPEEWEARSRRKKFQVISA